MKTNPFLVEGGINLNVKLVNYEKMELYRGTILRFRGSYPFTEEYTDFMLTEYPGCNDKCCPFALYCVSGYHAGCLEYVFPLEAKSKDSGSIDKCWLIEHWHDNIYGECNVDEIEIIL